jgi:DNA-binding beta-propeller fold protein YncE
MKHAWSALAGLGLVSAGILASRSPVQGATQGGTVQAPRFEVDPLWPKPLPNHWLLGSATGIAIDSRDHVYVIHLTDSFTPRTETGAGPANNNVTPAGECCSSAPNVLEFDADGNLVKSWGGPGQGFDWPAQNAGLGIDPSGNLWIGGIGGADTRILKFTKDGAFVAQYGKGFVAPPPAAPAAADTQYAGQSPGRGQAAAGRGGRGGRGGGRGAAPSAPPASTSLEAFGGATAFAFNAGSGELLVADGSRNRRIAVVDMNTGAIKRFFGAYGAAPEDAPTTYAPNDPPARQFSGVRCVETASDGTIYVCDSRNNRIQVFGKDGKFVREARIAPNTLANGSVWDIAFSRDPQQRFLYVADGSNMKVHVLERSSLNHLTSFGDGGRYPGQFLAVSGVATDSKGNLYTIEADQGKRLQRFVFKGVGAVSRNQGVLWPK